MSLVPQPSESSPTASESLAQTLVIGNTTGANDIVVSNPQKIDFAGNISLKNNSGGGGSDVIINSIPANGGPLLTQGLFYDTATNRVVRQFQQNETLAATLAIGNTTGAFDIIFTNPTRLLFRGDVNIQNNTGGLGSDVIMGIPPAPSPQQWELCYDPATQKVYYQQPLNSFPTQPATYTASTNPGPVANLQYVNNANLGMRSGDQYTSTYSVASLSAAYSPFPSAAPVLIIQGLNRKPYTATAQSGSLVGAGMPLTDRIWVKINTAIVFTGNITTQLGICLTITNTTTATTINNCYYNITGPRPKFIQGTYISSSNITIYSVEMEDCFVVGTSSFLSVNDNLRINIYGIWASPQSGTFTGIPTILEGVSRAFYPV